jgi:hypothetical protein
LFSEQIDLIKRHKKVRNKRELNRIKAVLADDDGYTRHPGKCRASVCNRMNIL